MPTVARPRAEARRPRSSSPNTRCSSSTDNRSSLQGRAGGMADQRDARRAEHEAVAADHVGSRRECDRAARLHRIERSLDTYPVGRPLPRRRSDTDGVAHRCPAAQAPLHARGPSRLRCRETPAGRSPGGGSVRMALEGYAWHSDPEELTDVVRPRSEQYRRAGADLLQRRQDARTIALAHTRGRNGDLMISATPRASARTGWRGSARPTSGSSRWLSPCPRPPDRHRPGCPAASMRPGTPAR